MSLEAALPRPTRFSIGRALGESIGIFARNAFWLVPIACVMGAVELLAPEEANDSTSSAWQDLVLGDATDALASGLTDAAIILGILQILRGHRVSIGDMAAGFRFVIPLVVATAIINLPWSLFNMIDQLWESENGMESFVRGLLAFAIALVFYVHWAVATQAVVIERIGPVAALVRSVRLTRGRRWAIFGVTIIPFIAIIGIYGAAALVTEFVITDDWLIEATDYFIAATSTAYFSVLTTILYYDLRREKEGADSGELARVFD